MLTKILGEYFSGEKQDRVQVDDNSATDFHNSLVFKLFSKYKHILIYLYYININT